MGGGLPRVDRIPLVLRRLGKFRSMVSWKESELWQETGGLAKEGRREEWKRKRPADCCTLPRLRYEELAYMSADLLRRAAPVARGG
jgi:hypothetical protein